MPKINLDKPTLRRIHTFLLETEKWRPANLKENWDELWFHSYQRWGKGGRAWDALQIGGTGIVRALIWYHQVHKPGSKEWRPSIIIRVLAEATQ